MAPPVVARWQAGEYSEAFAGEAASTTVKCGETGVAETAAGTNVGRERLERGGAIRDYAR
jgi:hypothetical protein